MSAPPAVRNLILRPASCGGSATIHAALIPDGPFSMATVASTTFVLDCVCEKEGMTAKTVKPMVSKAKNILELCFMNLLQLFDQVNFEYLPL
jgi:hypothetical protein